MRRVLQESRDRILAMSLIHQKLYQSTNLSRINFADYARELVRALLLVYGDTAARVTLVIPPSEVTLDVSQAVPCGIIIHEVVSNALKYAFPHERRGTIHVELQQDSDNQCHLLFWDDGVGLPPDFETRARSSLGTTLIKRLADQLQGTLEYHSSPQGVRYHLTFPQPIPTTQTQNNTEKAGIV
jgi:two-component sensor histidine kinase